MQRIRSAIVIKLTFRLNQVEITILYYKYAQIVWKCSVSYNLFNCLLSSTELSSKTHDNVNVNCLKSLPSTLICKHHVRPNLVSQLICRITSILCCGRYILSVMISNWKMFTYWINNNNNICKDPHISQWVLETMAEMGIL